MPREFHPDGYQKHTRQPIGKRQPNQRIRDYIEIWTSDWDEGTLQAQGERCMDCGVPVCMSGCPIGNRIPDWNDLVHRADWKAALDALHATNNFPEFTGFTCPAPCEDACVLAINDDPVTIKSIERAIVDRGWDEGWIQPQPPAARTGYRVAVVGSGPAGLSAAQQLNRAGHRVTVFERDDAIGGLMTYGIPDFKFAKFRVQRRVEQLRTEGIDFVTEANIGHTVDPEELFDRFDATCLAIGAQAPRALPIPGAGLEGVTYAMEYLIRANRKQAGTSVADEPSAAGKNVVVIGGGDTGADCVATAHRQGAEQVVQISIRQQPPKDRPSTNPWPEHPQTYRKTYAVEEGGTEEFGVNTTALLDTTGNGRVDALQAERVEWTLDARGRRVDKTVLDEDVRIPADLVLVAIGFSGPQAEPFTASGIELDGAGTVRTDDAMMTTREGVFAAGDAQRGASLVVWAIGEGRDVARQIDTYLTGASALPWSLRTPHRPLGAV